MTTTTALQPKAWVGCLGCYNEGRLTGKWLDGDVAADLQAAGLTGPDYTPQAGRCVKCGAEEFWVMDHEGYGGLLTGECNPVTAQNLAETLATVEEDQQAAFAAYAANLSLQPWQVTAETVEEFTDCYQGEWDSEKDFAWYLFEELGWERALEEAGISTSYFDVDAYARDLFLDGYSSVKTPEFTYWVFADR